MLPNRTILLCVTLFIAACIVVVAQPNIFPANGSVGIGTGANGPLNKLHIHLDGQNQPPQPVLRFSYGALDPTDLQPIAQLAFCSTTPNALFYSQHATAGDLTIRTASTAGGENGNGRLILSSQHPNGSILFTTTQIATPVGVAASDLVRMRITAQGHVGIWQTDPKELLQIGNRMTFHVGFEDDYLGYNVYREKDPVTNLPFDKLIMGSTTPPIPGYALKYGMSRHGYLEIGAGSTPSALAGQSVDWYEGGSQFDAFAGLTIQNIGGKGCASLGKYYPVANCRLFIKAFSSGSTVTDALVAVSSSNAELLRVRNDGTVGIAQTAPKERLHIGELMTFHDGGGKFMGFNSYWDNNAGQLKNIEANRVSAIIGIGTGSAAPFTIQVDQNSSVGQIMGSGFKGVSIISSGNVGVGTLTPEARLDVRGLTGSSMDILMARSVSTTGPQGYMVVTSDGKVGVNTQAPKGALHVNGDVVIGVNQNTSDHAGFTNKLSVDGIIFTKEVRVLPGNWSDDVFRSDYVLASLSEVEQHINEHGHLEGIPSEQQALAEGVDVSVMQAALLRKIEELTLHLIALEKKLAGIERASK